MVAAQIKYWKIWGNQILCQWFWQKGNCICFKKKKTKNYITIQKAIILESIINKGLHIYLWCHCQVKLAMRKNIKIHKKDFKTEIPDLRLQIEHMLFRIYFTNYNIPLIPTFLPLFLEYFLPLEFSFWNSNWSAKTWAHGVSSQVPFVLI